MKKWFLPVAVIVVLGAGVLLSLVGTYNKMVTLDENVEKAWSQVENAYQRRAELIPNLVNTVKGAADFEQDTLTQVIEARSKATDVQVNVNDAASLAQFQQAQAGLSSALSKLMVVVEKYPELRATQQFADLMVSLEGTENRISTERRAFNETANTYNIFIRKFPNNMMAGMFGFEKKPLFEAMEGAEVAPVVDFLSDPAS